ncbi:MAG: hypothetical protein BWX44_01590 [Spirochaetes bacterium ADurb.Bin001]|nr:MAG: hypothetical protein BWX44_01590 [Spirochaetes bacterium ADurb.Bin001]
MAVRDGIILLGYIDDLTIVEINDTIRISNHSGKIARKKHLVFSHSNYERTSIASTHNATWFIRMDTGYSISPF